MASANTTTTTTTTPTTHRALVLSSLTTPATVRMVPKPTSTPGSAIVRILQADVLPYARTIYSGNRPGAVFPVPLVPGCSAVGRIESVGADATLLKPGDLVFVDVFIRGRDDPSAAILFGYRNGPTASSKKLIEGEWRDATYAEFAKVPLEMCHKLDEGRLLRSVEEKGLGYKLEQLGIVVILLVAYGGLRDIGLQAGETIIVAPATGSFGGAAVQVALAMGAKVVAVARNIDVLQKIAATKVAATSGRLEICQIKGNDVQADAKTLARLGPFDAYIDFSPPAAAKSTHIESCLNVLKPYGRVSLMGGIRGNVSIPYFTVIFKSLQLKGRWMYERADVVNLLKMVEVGILRLGPDAGHRVAGMFPLDQWEEACIEAEKNAGYGVVVLLKP